MQTVNVQCPRCSGTFPVRLTTDARTDSDGLAIVLTVPDLATPMAAHYKDAGHV